MNATANVPGADSSYPLLSRPIQTTYTQRQKQDTNHSINLDGDEESPSCRRHHSFDRTLVTFVSSGSHTMPKTVVTGSSKDAFCPRATLPVTTEPTGSLHQLLAEATLDEIPNHSPPLVHKFKLNPFRSPLHSTIMFPSLGTVLNDLINDHTSPQIELDGLGCALLPASEYILALESECNFHYEFWDGYNEVQYYFPIDITLHLDHARAPLYEYYALAMPSVPKIAVRLISLTVPTRFTRLLPKPRPSEADNDMVPEDDDPNDPGARYAYTTSYCGSIIEKQLTPAAEKEDNPDATGKEDKATGKGDKSAKKKDNKKPAPAKGIRLASNWKRLKPPSGGLTLPVSSPSLEETEDGEEGEDEDSSEIELERTRGASALDRDRRGFVLHAWVPVPLSLFQQKETCTFRIDARVWIENPYTLVRGENGRTRMSRRRWYRADIGRGRRKWEVGDFSEREDRGGVLRMVETSQMVTVSHLQSGREMI